MGSGIWIPRCRRYPALNIHTRQEPVCAAPLACPRRGAFPREALDGSSNWRCYRPDARTAAGSRVCGSFSLVLAGTLLSISIRARRSASFRDARGGRTMASRRGRVSIFRESRALEADDDVPLPRRNSAVVRPVSYATEPPPREVLGRLDLAIDTYSRGRRRERGFRDPFGYRNPTYTRHDTDSAGTGRVHGTFLASGRLPDTTYADSTDSKVTVTVCSDHSPSPCRGRAWERIP
jgi:hypothetical protein